MRHALGLGASLTLAALSACGGAGAPAGRAARQLPVVRPDRGDLSRTITLPGDLIGFNEAALHAKVTGYVARIDVDKGDRVHKGQVLAVLEVPELKQKLARARASLEVRRLAYERLRRVWKSDPRVVARQDVDVAAGEFQQARAKVEELEALWGYTSIVAPFDGVVTARYVDPGALVPAAGQTGSLGTGGSGVARGPTPVVTVADITVLRVYVYVPESEAGRITEGMPAVIRVRQLPEQDLHGTVARFAKALDLSTRTMLTEVDLPNPDHKLYPGMYADVSLELERHPETLRLPATAIARAARGTFVYVIEDGRLKKIAVTTGITDGAMAEVVSGLTGDEQVARNVPSGLEEGDQVTPVASDGGTPAGR